MAGPMRALDPRLPVLVGLGVANEPAPVVDLMTAAVVAAGADAGAPALLSAVDCVAVPQGSWSLTDPARTVARRIGADGARTLLCEIGVSQQEVINHALAAVAAGWLDSVVVVGGEARAWERDGGIETDDADRAPDDVLTRPTDFVAPVEVAAGMVWPPVQQYALIENALAHALHLSLDEEREDVANLWARFNAMAADNPEAAFPQRRDAAQIGLTGPHNRPLAFPYNRWHSSQWTVNQASALLICSAGRAQSAGVPPDRWLFPHVALHSSQAVTLTARRRLEQWPAMGVLGRAAARHLGHPLADLPLAEVYSCFPAAVRVQQRELGLDPAGTPTLGGGMAFAGGPFNHFVLQSLCGLGRRLRDEPDVRGLLTTVSGMLSKPGLAVWSATPMPEETEPLLTDLAAEGLAATAIAPVVEVPPREATPATVASFTVTYGGAEGYDPVRTVIVADLPDGTRTAAASDDPATAQHAVGESLIGRTVSVRDAAFTL